MDTIVNRPAAPVIVESSWGEFRLQGRIKRNGERRLVARSRSCRAVTKRKLLPANAAVNRPLRI